MATSRDRMSFSRCSPAGIRQMRRAAWQRDAAGCPDAHNGHPANKTAMQPARPQRRNAERTTRVKKQTVVFYR